MSTPPAVPRVAEKMAARLHRATGTQPVITAVDGALWQLVLENERVRLTIDYRGRLGKVKWAGSALTVNGKQRPLARDFDDFVRIWREHSGKRSRTPELMPVPSGAYLTNMPMEILAFYERLRAAADAAGLSELPVDAGFINGRWVIGVTLPSGGARFAFVRQGPGKRWNFSPHLLQVIQNGRGPERRGPG